ncbi:MAG: M56 family metallopeptidase [Holophagaceae bacterium]
MSAPEVLLNAWAWALVHFLWQGCLIGGLAWAALRLLRGARPELRYGMACAALALMVAAPVATGALLRRAASVTAMGSAAPRTLAPAMEVAVEAAPASAPPTLQARLQPVLPWILGIWSAGVALLSLRLLGGWAWMQRLRHAKAARAAEEWQTLVRVLARRMGLARDVLLLLCERLESPVALGVLRPVILMPPALLTGLEPLALEAVLLHELAHIRRQDYLVNLLQSVAETLLFYHPAVWWISAVIRQERENACDDAAVRHTGDAVAYARTLSLLEEFRMDTRLKPATHPAPAATGGSLLARVRRLLAPAPAAAPLAPRAAVLGLLAAGLLGAATAAPRGREDEQPAEKKAARRVMVVSESGREGATKLRLKLVGEARLEDVRKDFSRMSPGSSIQVTEGDKAFKAERTKEGAYSETYTVQGQAEPITGDVRAWAQGRLPESIREADGHRIVVGDGDGKVIVGKDGKVVVGDGGRKHVVIVRKGPRDGAAGKDGQPKVEKDIIIRRDGAGSDADTDVDFDFGGDAKVIHLGPDFELQMKQLDAELTKELPKMRLQMKELHKLGPELEQEMAKLHKELGDGKLRTFVFKGGDGDFSFDAGQGREVGRKARLKALKGLASSLARDAEDTETKAALGRIQAEIEALEARQKQ